MEGLEVLAQFEARSAVAPEALQGEYCVFALGATMGLLETRLSPVFWSQSICLPPADILLSAGG